MSAQLAVASRGARAHAAEISPPEPVRLGELLPDLVARYAVRLEAP
ncbi:MAG: hypothetical protein K1X74_18285 [Pirellulales bacterium]|nr:hypothetical protein [Pirellulales bacterium]